MTSSTDLITVTVAPGGSVSISPHPSGLPQLGPLTLRPGETHQVDQAEAERLYQRGDILHPTTGKPKPEPARIEGPTISYDGGPPISTSNTAALISASRHAEEKAVAEANRRNEARRQEEIRQRGPGMQPLRQTGVIQICHDETGIFRDIANGSFW